MEFEVVMETLNKKKFWVIVVIVAAVVAVGALIKFNVIPVGFLNGNAKTYQAVFLTNGQVYFGHLSNMNAEYADLRDVYYLQVTQPPQPIQVGQTQPTNINLVKLGGELHAPKDEMRINRASILFIEDLEDNSRVIDAINKLNGGK